MIEAESIADRFPLPAPPEGWFEYGYGPLADQRLAIVRVRTDFHADYMRWWEVFQGGDHTRRSPTLEKGELRLSIFDGTAETDAVIVPSTAYPVVDRMPDGRWLVAGSRASAKERNGRIYSIDGRKERDMVLGDGIETMLCAPDGTIWVGYFDEGVFADSNRDGSWPVSCGGIVQFDEAGGVLWSFNDRRGEKHVVDDAYAITLCGNHLWACYYSHFPITRISGGVTTAWSNPIDGATAIAVKDDLVLLAGGYTKNANRIVIAKLEDGRSRELGRLRYTPGGPGAAGLLQGRGGTLHIVSGGVWSKLSVYRAAEAIDADDGSGGGT